MYKMNINLEKVPDSYVQQICQIQYALCQPRNFVFSGFVRFSVT